MISIYDEKLHSNLRGKDWWRSFKETIGKREDLDGKLHLVAPGYGEEVWIKFILATGGETNVKMDEFKFEDLCKRPDAFIFWLSGEGDLIIAGD